MTCSTHNEGSRIVNAYPTNYKGEFLSLEVLAACDKFRELLRHVGKNYYHYKICGKDVVAGVIPSLKWEDTISGNSVATALAAGLCSLILTCDLLVNPDKRYVTGEKSISSPNTLYAVVKGHLKKMQSEPGNQFVLLEKLGEIGTLRIGDTVLDKPEMAMSGGRSAKSVLETFKRHKCYIYE